MVNEQPGPKEKGVGNNESNCNVLVDHKLVHQSKETGWQT
jgi:hypothetical protein